jgi:hypothetical protein
MKYVEFKSRIENELKNNPDGKTWKELKSNLKLPYKNPCPTWVSNLEKEIGVTRNNRRGRELVWKI